MKIFQINGNLFSVFTILLKLMNLRWLMYCSLPILFYHVVLFRSVAIYTVKWTSSYL